MSGGHWNNLSRTLEKQAETVQDVSQALLFLAAIEIELDWGHSCDTCLACARLRVVAALDTFFDYKAMDAAPAIAVARDDKQHRCPKCAARYKEGR